MKGKERISKAGSVPKETKERCLLRPNTRERETSQSKGGKKLESQND